MSNNTSGASGRPYFMVAILALLLLSGILFYNNQSLKNENAAIVGQLEDEKQALEADFQRTLQELEAYKMEAEEMDSTLADMMGDMEAQKAKIEKLLRKDRNSRSELSEAKNLLASLRSNADNYKRELDALRYENQRLGYENQTLKGTLATKADSIKRLSADRTTLANQKADLEEKTSELSTQASNLSEQNDLLSSKVNRAEIMQLTNITTNGVRFKRNGKEVEVKKAKRAEKLRVCFDMLKNPIAPAGMKDILVQIVDPEGVPLWIESMGSGLFTHAESGEERKYTTKAEIPYKGQDGSYCMYWEQNSAFVPGNYLAELYQDGHLIGTKSLSLQ